jgi:RNA polymerase sigma-70 factor (ECF subfamily)
MSEAGAAEGVPDRPASALEYPPGSEDAFDALYRETWPRAVASARALTNDMGRAEELAQEAFTRAFDRWRQVSKHPAPSAWVLRVTINLAIDDARRRKRRPTSELPPDFVQRQHRDHELETVTNLDVSAALASLPPKQRQAVTLRYIAGLDEPEIAAAIGVRRGTVKTHLKRGIAKLRETLGPDVVVEPSLGL